MEPRKLIIILDPAHGKNIKGKCSPDKSHYEWEWSRKICKMLANKLPDLGFKVYYTNTSEDEIGLSRRVKNAECISCPSDCKKLLVSLHNNAAGDGSAWCGARGYEIYTSKGQTKSDKYADIIMTHLRHDFKSTEGIRERVDLSDMDYDKEQNFTVLTGDYSAVLIEWLFQDNQRDLEMLEDNNINQMFVSSLVKALMEIDTNLDLL